MAAGGGRAADAGAAAGAMGAVLGRGVGHVIPSAARAGGPGTSLQKIACGSGMTVVGARNDR